MSVGSRHNESSAFIFFREKTSEYSQLKFFNVFCLTSILGSHFSYLKQKGNKRPVFRENFLEIKCILNDQQKQQHSDSKSIFSSVTNNVRQKSPDNWNFCGGTTRRRFRARDDLISGSRK
jgi:hypothetical protein